MDLASYSIVAMAVVADHAVVEMEISLTVEERLDKQR